MSNSLQQRIARLEAVKRGRAELEDDGLITALRPPEVDEKDWKYTDYMKAIEATAANDWKDYGKEEVFNQIEEYAR